MITTTRRLRAARAEASAARAEADGLRARAAVVEEAVDVLPAGFVVRFGDGTRLRNAVARSMAAARSADVIAERAMEELLGEAVASGQPQSRTVRLHGPPPRVLMLTARPVGGDAAVGVIEDATERHHLDAVRRDFVANVSHELRTPLGALGALADAVAGQHDPEVIQRLAARMTGEVARASQLVDDLLDLSRIEASGPAPVDPVDLVALARTCVAAVEPAAMARSVTVSLVAPSADVVVPGDRDQLRSAITNLLDNAVKYSDPGTEVTVEVAGDAAGTATLVVRDRGIGIPPGERDRIFERFYRVDRARSRETGGTGLGLAIVRHVALNHGGDVTVESVEGAGSTFSLQLPRQRS